MPDALFVGFKDYGWGNRTSPLICFRNVEDAIKWKNEETDRDFKLVELK